MVRVILLFLTTFTPTAEQSIDMLFFALSRPLSCVLSVSPSVYAPKIQTC